MLVFPYVCIPKNPKPQYPTQEEDAQGAISTFVKKAKMNRVRQVAAVYKMPH